MILVHTSHVVLKQVRKQCILNISWYNPDNVKTHWSPFTVSRSQILAASSDSGGGGHSSSGGSCSGSCWSCSGGCSLQDGKDKLEESLGVDRCCGAGGLQKKRKKKQNKDFTTSHICVF